MQERFHTDTLIIGSGIAGSVAAIELADAGVDVTLVTRAADATESNSKYAQGGIIYARGLNDSPEKLRADILTAGAGWSNPDAVDAIVTEGARLVDEILIGKAGVEFDPGTDGSIDLTREGGHGERRIAHVADSTGRTIQEQLNHAMQLRPNIHLLTGVTAVDLITPSHHATDPMYRYEPLQTNGAYLFDQTEGTVVAALSDNTILATGGLGQIYRYTTNPEGSRGDGLAMAFRAGARISNLEFIQFHPTAFVHRDAPRFLISEAVRGEGGRLVDADNVPFMEQYDPIRKDLATRDLVSRSIYNEMLRRGVSNMYLNLAGYIPKEHILKHFPTIYQTLLSHGVDITRDLVPVAPAAHYSCGGIWTDMRGRTSIDRLYAVGEVANTGLHGANRLASTSLLEGVVFGARAAHDILENGMPMTIPDSVIREWINTGSETADPALIAQDMATLRSTMWNYVGLVRKTPLLARAIRDLSNLEDEINRFYHQSALSDQLIGLRNAVQTGLLVTRAAWENKISVGSHYRE